MRRMFLAVLTSAFFMTGWAIAATPDLSFINSPSSRALIPLPAQSRSNPDATSALWLNPAGIGLDGTSGSILLWPASRSENVLFDGRQYGLALNAGRMAIGYETFRDSTGATSRTSWGFSLPLAEGFSLGATYHWSHGLNRENAWDLGLITRPTRWLSFGTQVTDLGGVHLDGAEVNPTWHLAAAIRPFGPRLTLSADGTLWKTANNAYGNNPDARFLADWEVLHGVHLHGGYSVDSKLMFAGVSITTGLFEAGSFAATEDRSDPRDAGGVWVRSSTKRIPSILDTFSPKQIVHIKLSGPLVEEPDPFSFFFPRHRSLIKLLQRLEQIRHDDGVAGVILEFDNFRAGRGDLEELRDEILALREDDIKVATYSRQYGMGTIYLASAADRAWLYPAGMVIVPGVRFENLYARELLDTLHLKPEFYTVGEYKSAAEPLTRSSMSREAREELDAVAATWYRDWVEAVSTGRSVSTDLASAWIDSALMSGQEAVDAGLLDALLYPDEVEKIAKRQLGEGLSTFVTSEASYAAMPEADPNWENLSSPKVAVVYAEGMIVGGKSERNFLTDERTLGSETLVEAIREARNNRRVKAIVLRVDSPGGWALAADVVAREVRRTVDHSIEDVRHVPLIVSMSDLAASGGYYISALADSIVATRTTITGSIGVVYGRVNVSGLLDTIGVHLDGVHQGRNAGMTGLAPWNDEQVRILRKSMDDTYDHFIETVSRGRAMSKQDVDRIGRGRVWTGEEAIKLGLVDAQGGLLDAIRIAATAAGLKTPERVGVLIYPRERGMGMQTGFSQAAVSTLPEPIRTLVRLQTHGDDDGRVLMLAPFGREDVTIR